jgi:ATP-dependent Clp protease ATP-binding subunit ClpC
VGHGDGGQLTEKVRQRPYSVVLFDEVEKAHPDVMHMLLQILEEGTLTDSMGRQVDFRNVVVIMTSNLGAALARKGSSLGFNDNTGETDYAKLKERMLEEAKRSFKPEFLNRIDDIMVFRPLTREHVSEILDLELNKVQARLLHRGGVNLELSDDSREFLIEKGFDAEFGARPMRRAVEKHLEDPLAEEILRGNLEETHTIIAEVDADRLTFRSVEVKAEEPELVEEKSD